MQRRCRCRRHQGIVRCARQASSLQMMAPPASLQCTTSSFHKSYLEPQEIKWNPPLHLLRWCKVRQHLLLPPSRWAPLPSWCPRSSITRQSTSACMIGIKSSLTLFETTSRRRLYSHWKIFLLPIYMLCWWVILQDLVLPEKICYHTNE